MKDKALKKYIEEKYFVKIKKVRIWDLVSSLIPDHYYVITHKEQLDHLSSGWVISNYRLFSNLSQIYDYLNLTTKCKKDLEEKDYD